MKPSEMRSFILGVFVGALSIALALARYAQREMDEIAKRL
jgi:hypothetical protein